MQFAENSDNLCKKIDSLRYKKVNYSNSDICDLLGEFTEVYDIDWKFDIFEYGIIFPPNKMNDYKLQSFPGDFMMQLQELLYVANRNFKQIHYSFFDHAFQCYNSADLHEQESEWLTRCDRCGNVWDGNAQCMCFLDFSSQSESQSFDEI